MSKLLAHSDAACNQATQRHKVAPHIQVVVDASHREDVAADNACSASQGAPRALLSVKHGQAHAATEA
jgi:TPP-dependent indolepyruvate ferredoxin oxidoreductase alpha subunit